VSHYSPGALVLEDDQNAPTMEIEEADTPTGRASASGPPSASGSQGQSARACSVVKGAKAAPLAEESLTAIKMAHAARCEVDGAIEISKEPLSEEQKARATRRGLIVGAELSISAKKARAEQLAREAAAEVQVAKAARLEAKAAVAMEAAAEAEKAVVFRSNASSTDDAEDAHEADRNLGLGPDQQYEQYAQDAQRQGCAVHLPVGNRKPEADTGPELYRKYTQNARKHGREVHSSRENREIVEAAMGKPVFSVTLE